MKRLRQTSAPFFHVAMPGQTHTAHDIPSEMRIDEMRCDEMMHVWNLLQELRSRVTSMAAMATAPPSDDRHVSCGTHVSNGNTSSSSTCVATDAAECHEGSSRGEREAGEEESAREEGEDRGGRGREGVEMESLRMEQLPTDCGGPSFSGGRKGRRTMIRSGDGDGRGEIESRGGERGGEGGGERRRREREDVRHSGVMSEMTYPMTPIGHIRTIFMQR